MTDADLERYWRRRREIEERQDLEIARISADVAELGESVGQLSAAVQSMVGAMIGRFEERGRSSAVTDAEASFLDYLRGLAGRLDPAREEAAAAAFANELRDLTIRRAELRARHPR